MKAKFSLLDLIAVCVYAFLYAPIMVLILFSFEKSKIAVEWTGFTLNWYLQLFQDQALGLAVFNSLFVATIAVALAAVMGTMAAVGLARLKFTGKSIYRGAVMLPIIIPEIAMAVSALTLFIFLGVHLSLATVIVSHVVFCVSYMVLIVMARLDGINPSLEEAARDLGASPLQAFFKVTLPLLAPGIVAGSLMAFVLSLDDFIITQFNAGVGATTLPLRIYSMVKFGVSPEINALSTLMIAATVGLTGVAEIVRRRGARQATNQV